MLIPPILVSWMSSDVRMTMVLLLVHLHQHWDTSSRHGALDVFLSNDFICLIHPNMVSFTPNPNIIMSLRQLWTLVIANALHMTCAFYHVVNNLWIERRNQSFLVALIAAFVPFNLKLSHVLRATKRYICMMISTSANSHCNHGWPVSAMHKLLTRWG